MIVLLSPAKTLDFDGLAPPAATRPRFETEAAALARSAARLSQKRLRELMGISPDLAKLNADRFRDFGVAPERPAIHAFAGDVYRGLDAATLSDAALDRAQERLRLLSGLYGLLRPHDAIRPYRLEMRTRWAPRHVRLTDWWGGRIAAAVKEDLAAIGADAVVNLASKEYFAAVEGRLPASVRVVEVDFREGTDRRFISFHAKRARGSLARWILERGASTPDALRGFDADGYGLDAETSTADRLVFVRP